MKATKNHVRFLALNYLGEGENGEITAPDPESIRTNGASCVKEAEKAFSKTLDKTLGKGCSDGRDAIESTANRLASACEEMAYEEGIKAGAQLILQLLGLNLMPKQVDAASIA